jgi:hypothetical protein
MMLNDRLTAARDIQTEIKTAEAAIDDALASLGRLTGKLVETRREFEIGLDVGAKAFDRIGEATALICQVRAKVLGVHSVLSDVRETAPGFRELGYGAWQPSERAASKEEAPQLRAVA